MLFLFYSFLVFLLFVVVDFFFFLHDRSCCYFVWGANSHSTSFASISPNMITSMPVYTFCCIYICKCFVSWSLSVAVHALYLCAFITSRSFVSLSLSLSCLPFCMYAVCRIFKCAQVCACDGFLHISISQIVRSFVCVLFVRLFVRLVRCLLLTVSCALNHKLLVYRRFIHQMRVRISIFIWQ